MEPSLLVNDGYIVQRERFSILTHIVFRRTDFVAFEYGVSESNPDCPVPLCIDKLFSYPLKSGRDADTGGQLEALNMDALSTWGTAVKELRRRTNHHPHFSFEEASWN